MPKINQAELSKIFLYIPLDSEQQRIAAYLDAKCAEIDAIIAQKQVLLDKLAAYKKSLIFECVTGHRQAGGGGMSDNTTPAVQPGGEILIYQAAEGDTRLEVRLEDDTVWLSQQQMAVLFQTSKSNINEHIKHIFAEGELERESVVRNFRTTAADGKTYNVSFYNLDMIISLGYRVKSLIATQFRRWATQRLSEYMRKGFTLDDERLKQLGGGDYWQELLDRIRDIRSSEKVMYRQVLDLYATSVDYDPKSRESAAFFKMVQNKLHFAAHGQTAAVIYARAGGGLRRGHCQGVPQTAGKEGSVLTAAAATLKPVVEKVSRLKEEERRAFRTGLARFVRLYNFVTQICRMFDEDMHIYSLFAKSLAAALPTEAEGLPDLDGQIDLEYYKLTKTGEGGIELAPAETGFPGIKGDSGAAGEKDFSTLSDIVQKINQRFGTRFDPNDQVHTLRQIAEHVAASDHRLADLAGEEDAGTWNMVYDSVFASGVAEAALSNAAFFELINKTPDALDFLKGQLRETVWEKLRGIHEHS